MNSEEDSLSFPNSLIEEKKFIIKTDKAIKMDLFLSMLFQFIQKMNFYQENIN